MIYWSLVLTIALPWLGALCAWLTGDRHPKLLHTLAVIFSVASGLATLAMLPLASRFAAFRIPIGGIIGDFTLVPDGLGLLIAAIASVIGSLAVIFSINYMKHHEEQLARYYALILFFIGAMAGLGLSGNLFFTFLFWEITALCSYALISFHNDDPKAVAGGVKALIMTQIGGVGLLAGALLAYSYFGDMQISTFLAQARLLPVGVLRLMAFGFLVAAAAKSAQVPFHSWLPDAMEAPTPVTALIHAATMVNAGVYLLARFYPAFEGVPGWRTAVTVVGLLSALLAGIMAVAADDIKRVLAYSTISQLGFMVYAVGTGSIFASQFHLFSHAIFKALLFLGAGAIITAMGTRDLHKMGGLGKKMPFVRLVFIIGTLGLVGLPIANGFFSKDLILEGGLANGPLWAYILMLICVAITALYSLRLVLMVFYGPEHGTEPLHDAQPAMRISLSLLAIGTLTSWLLAGGLSRLMAGTLPFHEIELETTLGMAGKLFLAPATWIALSMVGAGILVWSLRSRLVRIGQVLKPAVTAGLGFEWINQRIAGLTKGAASLLQVTQTGQLNWNIAGILGGLALILAILVRGRTMNIPAFLWLILVPLLASPLIYLAGRLFKQARFNRLPNLLALSALLAAWIPLTGAAVALVKGRELTYTLGSITLTMDGIGLLLAVATLGLGTLVTLYSGPYLAREEGKEKFYAMLVLMISMICGLGCATDLFNLWIWFEAMAVTSYLLVAFYREQPASLEAGIKYLVQSAAGSVLIVVGIALVLASTGSLGLAQVGAAVAGTYSPLMLAAGALFVIGFGVKAALVPMHTWLPDAHSQAPSGISAMLSGVVIEAGLIAMLRALGPLFSTTLSWPALLIVLGAINMLLGNLMALRQKQVKRLLAFSSVAHVGYILLGLGISFYSGSTAGAQGSFFHIFNHALMKGLAFLSAGALLFTLHIRAGDHEPLVISDLNGAARRYPWAALGLSIALLALGGLPPLAGFMSKWQIFAAGFQTRNTWIELAVIFAALNSVLSLAYYAPLINAMYRLKASARVQQGKRLPAVMTFTMVLLGLAVVVIGVWPSLMNWLTVPAANALLAGLVH